MLTSSTFKDNHICGRVGHVWPFPALCKGRGKATSPTFCTRKVFFPLLTGVPCRPWKYAFFPSFCPQKGGAFHPAMGKSRAGPFLKAFDVLYTAPIEVRGSSKRDFLSLPLCVVSPPCNKHFVPERARACVPPPPFSAQTEGERQLIFRRSRERVRSGEVGKCIFFGKGTPALAITKNEKY